MSKPYSFPERINIPISKEMYEAIQKHVQKLQGESPGMTRTVWARELIAKALLDK